jgi:hypothetical protein
MRQHLILSLILGLLGLMFFVDYTLLKEAYGSGPPYYGRSVNMDKWMDPLPVVIWFDVIVAVIAGGLCWLWLRGQRR